MFQLNVSAWVAMKSPEYPCFQAEDYNQNVLTNYQNNPVIKVTMQFYKWEYPIGYVGGVAVNAYDFYFLRTRISRRAKD